MKTTLLLTAAAAILAVPAISAAQTHRAPAKKPTPAAASPAPTAPAAKTEVTPPPPPPPHAIPETGVLTNEDAVAIMKTTEKATSDQFAADPSEKWVGRQVAADLPKSASYFTYDRDTQFLKVTLTNIYGLELLEEKHDLGVAEGMNGYGAKVTFTRVRTDHYDLNVATGGPYNASFVYQVKLDGEAARALSELVRFRVKGTITKRLDDPILAKYAPAGSSLSKPNLIKTDYYSHSATVAEPFENSASYHELNVKDITVEAYNIKTGEVLNTWKQ